MALSDNREVVTVPLCIEDWAVLVTALAMSQASVADKERINSTIFDCARSTERVLS